MFHGKTHYKWPFSIAMLHYQRVYPEIQNSLTIQDFAEASFPHSFDEVHPELNGDVPVPSSQALGSFQRVYDKKKGVK